MTDTPSLKASILVVDDTQYNLDFLMRILAKRGYQVHPASNGPGALLVAQTTPIDLILLDIMMPDMSGYEVCERLKADERTHNIPVIFLSALSEVPDKLRAFSLGGVDYITKPFRSEEVMARIETHLTLRRLQLSLEDKNAQLQAEIAVRKAAEESLRQRTLELEARNEELDAFAHTVAHDLKNPLHIIRGYTALLETELQSGKALMPDEFELLLTGMMSGVNKMNAIIEGLLLLAGVRKQTGNLLTELNMASIVAEAQDRETNLIQEHRAEIVVPASWPIALGYDQWVEEIWTNFLSNAIKYGGRPPYIEMGATSQPDGMIRFWVRDNGPGLSEEQQQHLFTPFTRLHLERGTGHGLGLSIVQRIAEKLGGQVGVESQPGAGCIFWFSLPSASNQLTDITR